MRAEADARTVSSVTHRVPAAAEGRYRLTFSAVGGFGAVFGGRRTNANGGFNEVGVSQVPLRPSSIHPVTPRHALPRTAAAPPGNVSAAQKRTSQLRVSNKSQMKREMGATGAQ